MSNKKPIEAFHEEGMTLILGRASGEEGAVLRKLAGAWERVGTNYGEVYDRFGQTQPLEQTRSQIDLYM